MLTQPPIDPHPPQDRHTLPLAGGPAADQLVGASSEALLRRLRASILTVVALLAGLGLLRVGFITGWWRRVVIEGPSMAPTLWGTSVRVVCADCGFPFRCAGEHLPADLRAVCPNCGYTDNLWSRGTVLPPDRVLIDRWPLGKGLAEAGDVVAVRLPEAGSELAVKRVAARGGRALSIRDGDLYLDGELVRKTRHELAAVQVLVHDNDYQPRKTAGLPPRWQPASPSSRWKAQGTRIRFAPPAGSVPPTAPQAGRSGFDWLEYVHWPCTARPWQRTVRSPVLDSDSTNPSAAPRPLNVVPDVLCTCRLRVQGSGQLALAAEDGPQRLVLILEPGRRVVLQAGEAPEVLLERPLDIRFRHNPLDIEFGLVDQQVLLAVEGRTIVRYPYQRMHSPPQPTLRPLAIGARGLVVELEHLRVWRDLYYLDPQGLSRAWDCPATGSRHDLFLLGDNPPLSVDSRHWHPPHVGREHLLGRVYPAFWARRPQ